MTNTSNGELRMTNGERTRTPRHSSFVVRHSSFAATLLVLTCLLAPLSPAQAPSADALIKEALTAYKSGRIELAIEKLRKAHKSAPANPHARLYLGLLLYQQNPASLEAQGLMESVLDQFPSNPDLLLRLTDSYLASNKASKVPPLLERTRQVRPADRRLAFNIVYILVRYAQLDDARRELDAIYASLRTAESDTAKPDPKLALESGEVSFIRGLISATAGQKEEAMRRFQEADRNDFPPPDSPQMKMLAEALFRFEEYSLAAQAYQVYLAHFPQDLDARFRMSVCYFSSTAFERARKELERVYEKAPDMPDVHYYMGLVALETKNLEEARRQFEAELKISPASNQAMTEIAYLEYAQGDNGKCLRWLEKAIALDSDWPETNFVYGLLYNRLGNYDLAVKSLEKAVQGNPNHIKAQLQLSIAYRRIGNEAKAKEHADIYNKLLEAHKERTLGEDPRRK